MYVNKLWRTNFSFFFQGYELFREQQTLFRGSKWVHLPHKARLRQQAEEGRQCQVKRLVCLVYLCNIWGRILGRNWDKSLKRFPPCYSQSSLLTDFTTPFEQKGLKLVCNVNIVYRNLQFEHSQDYAQKPQLKYTCTFMNSASGSWDYSRFTNSVTDCWLVTNVYNHR
jgi:hypothetical protein